MNVSDPVEARKFIATALTEYANTLQPTPRFALITMAEVALQTITKPAAAPPVPAPVVDVPSG
ncbi:MAG: hypothetical protein RLZZ524_830 [Pseudomonadota bacterium]